MDRRLPDWANFARADSETKVDADGKWKIRALQRMGGNDKKREWITYSLGKEATTRKEFGRMKGDGDKFQLELIDENGNIVSIWSR